MRHLRTEVTYELAAGERPVAEQPMGNGLRRVDPRTLTVTRYPDGRLYLMLHGPTIRRNGTTGRYASVGWSWPVDIWWDQGQMPAWLVTEAEDRVRS